ncbi:MAG: SpoIID/LytB domain-containing protein [Brevinematia bacterium]
MKVIVVLIFLVSLLSCGMEKPSLKVAPYLRVLLTNANSMKIDAGNFVLMHQKGKEIAQGNIFVKISDGILLLNDVPYGSFAKIEIAPEKYFEINGKKYRGNLEILYTNGTIYFINIVDIESYLYSVVPSEVYPSWEKEALKAQAVVSRTFALYEFSYSRGKQKFFDVYSDTRSQVYKGMEMEIEKINEIVNQTSGEVLKYRGMIIPAFFHSSSGGMTESSKAYFGYEKPYLVPVESKYSSTYPENKWSYSISAEKFSKIFNVKNEITEVRVIKRTGSKRIDEVVIIDVQNQTNIISGKDLRSKLGESNVKSLRANIFLTNGEILFQGYGFGHGVGLPQWDAQGMAKEGKDYKTILKYFFPGVSIDKIW